MLNALRGKSSPNVRSASLFLSSLEDRSRVFLFGGALALQQGGWVSTLQGQHVLNNSLKNYDLYNEYIQFGLSWYGFI